MFKQSQSPLTGQFNFYPDVTLPEEGGTILSQSPLTGQFNFYMHETVFILLSCRTSLNPL